MRTSCPEATPSLTLVEASAFGLGHHHPAARAIVDHVRPLGSHLPDAEWVVEFLKIVGRDPDAFPPEFLAAALPLVPVVRRGRPSWESELPIAALSSASFPKLVVSGGHSAAFKAICDDLAERIRASCLAVTGAGHEIQFAGPPLNEALLKLWRGSTH